MPLSHRARVASAKEQGVPAEDVLRFAHPKEYVKVLEAVKSAFSPQAATEGLAFVRMMSDSWKGPAHPTFSWKRKVSEDRPGPHVSDRAAGVIKSVKDVVDTIKDTCRQAVFGRKVLAFHVRAMYLDMASKLRKMLAPMLQDVPDAVDLWVNTPWSGEWPFAISRKGCKVKPGREQDQQVQGVKNSLSSS